MTALLGRSMAADWPTYPSRRKTPAMDKLTALAAEAADLRPDGALIGITYLADVWQITVHIEVPEAFGHCDDMIDDTDPFGVITVTADTLDAALAEAARRVSAAVADTPCPHIP